jgi:hypothetical protein
LGLLCVAEFESLDVMILQFKLESHDSGREDEAKSACSSVGWLRGPCDNQRLADARCDKTGQPFEGVMFG